MKISLYAFSALLFISTLSAHPAKRVEAVKTQDGIKISIFHKVRRPQHHFLDHIIISNNGQIINEIKVTKDTGQTTKQAYIIILPDTNLGAGDQITVFSHCNEGGDLEQTVTIG